MLGIATDVEDRDKVTKFVTKLGVTYPQVLSDDKLEKQFGRIRGMPTTFIYDPRGKLVMRREGPLDRAALDKATGVK